MTPARALPFAADAHTSDIVNPGPSVGAAFEELVLEHYDAERGPLERYLTFLGVDADSSRDIVHDVFLKLHEYLLNGGAVTNLRAWLYRAAHNQAHNLRGAAFVRKSAPLGPESAAHPTARDLSPEQLLLAGERDGRLRAAVQELTPLQRQCLVLRSQGLKYREIAETQKLSVSTVAETVGRAVEHLRHLLA